jgi:hypothetical protein
MKGWVEREAVSFSFRHDFNMWRVARGKVDWDPYKGNGEGKRTRIEVWLECVGGELFPLEL